MTRTTTMPRHTRQNDRNLKWAGYLCPLLLTFTLLLSTSTHAFSETIYLSIAASMTDAMKAAIKDFSADRNGDRILANFASSGSLAKQIDQGAPAHLYISANPKWMDYLVTNKAVVPETKRTLAYNKLVFIATDPASIQNLSELKKIARIAIGSPGSVPAGQYTKQALEAADIYDHLEENNIFVMAKDVRQALLYADRGEVNGAFVYSTDALLARNAKIAFIVPEKLYSRVIYPVALTAKGAESKLAQDFYRYLTGDKGAEILEKFGFKPAQVE